MPFIPTPLSNAMTDLRRTAFLRAATKVHFSPQTRSQIAQIPDREVLIPLPACSDHHYTRSAVNNSIPPLGVMMCARKDGQSKKGGMAKPAAAGAAMPCGLSDFVLLSSFGLRHSSCFHDQA
jgi:hypothetical protein